MTSIKNLHNKVRSPLILYYFPKVAPSAFSDPQELIDICELPNVIGVKFTDFNYYLLQRLAKRGNLVFNGYDEALAAGLLMGAEGGIGSTYNLMPQVYQKIFQAAQRADSGDCALLAIALQCGTRDLVAVPILPCLARGYATPRI